MPEAIMTMMTVLTMQNMLTKAKRAKSWYDRGRVKMKEMMAKTTLRAIAHDL